MSFLVSFIIIIYVLPGLIAHLKKHVWNYQKRIVLYDENRNVLSIAKLTFLRHGQKFYFRNDGSLWKREDIKYGKPIKNSYQLYYPSAKSKFQSFTNPDIS